MKKGTKRFTLMEVLVALAVTGIAAMGILRLQIIGIEAALHAELVTRAGVIAESRMEQALAEARAENRPPEPDSAVVRMEETDVEFRWLLTVDEAGGDIAQMNGNEIRNLWHLRSRVSWGRENAARNIELERYVWSYHLE